MELFYVETTHGCGIRKARDLDEAERAIENEVGFNNVKEVHEASRDEIEWVRAAGGDIPKIKEQS